MSQNSPLYRMGCTAATVFFLVCLIFLARGCHRAVQAGEPIFQPQPRFTLDQVVRVCGRGHYGPHPQDGSYYAPLGPNSAYGPIKAIVWNPEAKVWVYRIRTGEEKILWFWSATYAWYDEDDLFMQ